MGFRGRAKVEKKKKMEPVSLSSHCAPCVLQPRFLARGKERTVQSKLGSVENLTEQGLQEEELGALGWVSGRR